ncbi:4-hydroxy-tetrahydrodipicolinate reductase [Simkania negevensis]|uniref:4-hydroxy-tetrahydrodipicolinate reductase n=1 Tax=Simkania negevensis TaxID=83561 RepID=A0ABS3AQL5_9BACT|nr:4-hydroxy-tetrahydrodipicolinate reductase [Simkania negevensis]
MKVALLGYGKMGQAIEKKAPDMGIEVVARIRSNATKAEWEAVEAADVCIDFSHPDALVGNMEKALLLQKPAVVGTTGWYSDIDHIQALVTKHNLGIIYAQNFAMGINLFMQIVAKAAQLIDGFNHYDVAVTETHHRHKVDSPSGTAHTIADLLLENICRKEKICTELNGKKIAPNELHVSAIRLGAVPGTHTVIFNSDHDTITLTHQAHDRSIWAHGALEAAKWIRSKKGLFHINDMIESSRDGIKKP